MDLATYEARRRFGRNVRDLRLQRGLTQTELGQRLGFAYPSSISSIEHARRLVHRDELDALARALDCDPTDLLPEAEAEAVPHPSPRGARHLVAMSVLLLAQLSATDLRAEEGERATPFRLAPLASGSDGASAEDAAPPPLLSREADPNNALIWGDNCDPTLLPQGLSPAS